MGWGGTAGDPPVRAQPVAPNGTWRIWGARWGSAPPNHLTVRKVSQVAGILLAIEQ